jgi:hypothetical protein
MKTVLIIIIVIVMLVIVGLIIYFATKKKNQNIQTNQIIVSKEILPYTSYLDISENPFSYEFLEKNGYGFMTESDNCIPALKNLTIEDSNEITRLKLIYYTNNSKSIDPVAVVNLSFQAATLALQIAYTIKSTQLQVLRNQMTKQALATARGPIGPLSSGAFGREVPLNQLPADINPIMPEPVRSAISSERRAIGVMDDVRADRPRPASKPVESKIVSKYNWDKPAGPTGRRPPVCGAGATGLPTSCVNVGIELASLQGESVALNPLAAPEENISLKAVQSKPDAEGNQLNLLLSEEGSLKAKQSLEKLTTTVEGLASASMILGTVGFMISIAVPIFIDLFGPKEIKPPNLTSAQITEIVTNVFRDENLRLEIQESHSILNLMQTYLDNYLIYKKADWVQNSCEECGDKTCKDCDIDSNCDCQNIKCITKTKSLPNNFIENILQNINTYDPNFAKRSATSGCTNTKLYGKRTVLSEYLITNIYTRIFTDKYTGIGTTTTPTDHPSIVEINDTSFWRVVTHNYDLCSGYHLIFAAYQTLALSCMQELALLTTDENPDTKDLYYPYNNSGIIGYPNLIGKAQPVTTLIGLWQRFAHDNFYYMRCLNCYFFKGLQYILGLGPQNDTPVENIVWEPFELNHDFGFGDRLVYGSTPGHRTHVHVRLMLRDNNKVTDDDDGKKNYIIEKGLTVLENIYEFYIEYTDEDQARYAISNNGINTLFSKSKIDMMKKYVIKTRNSIDELQSANTCAGILSLPYQINYIRNYDYQYLKNVPGYVLDCSYEGYQFVSSQSLPTGWEHKLSDTVYSTVLGGYPYGLTSIGFTEYLYQRDYYNRQPTTDKKLLIQFANTAGLYESVKILTGNTINMKSTDENLNSSIPQIVDASMFNDPLSSYENYTSLMYCDGANDADMIVSNLIPTMAPGNIGIRDPIYLSNDIHPIPKSRIAYCRNSKTQAIYPLKNLSEYNPPSVSSTDVSSTDVSLYNFVAFDITNIIFNEYLLGKDLYNDDVNNSSYILVMNNTNFKDKTPGVKVLEYHIFSNYITSNLYFVNTNKSQLKYNDNDIEIDINTDILFNNQEDRIRINIFGKIFENYASLYYNKEKFGDPLWNSNEIIAPRVLLPDYVLPIGTKLMVGTSLGIYVTPNFLQNNAYTIIPNITGVSFIYKTKLILPNRNNMIYALAHRDPIRGGRSWVYWSMDNGITWRDDPKDDRASAGLGGSLMIDDGSLSLIIAQAPRMVDSILFRSTNAREGISSFSIVPKTSSIPRYINALSYGGNNIFIIFGLNGPNSNIPAGCFSIDGLRWIPIDMNTQFRGTGIGQVVFNGKNFIAIRSTLSNVPRPPQSTWGYTSDDGMNWTSISNNIITRPNYISCSDNKALVLGLNDNNQVIGLVSLDYGKTWTTTIPNMFSGYTSTSFNDKYFMVFVRRANSQVLFYSTDLINWDTTSMNSVQQAVNSSVIN